MLKSVEHFCNSATNFRNPPDPLCFVRGAQSRDVRGMRTAAALLKHGPNEKTPFIVMTASHVRICRTQRSHDLLTDAEGAMSGVQFTNRAIADS